MEETTVGDVMTTEVATVQPSTPMTEIERLVQELRIGAVPVVDDGRLVGIVSQEDLLFSAADPRDWRHYELEQRRRRLRDVEEPTAAQLATTRIVSVSPSVTTTAAARLMLAHDVKRLPVVDEQGRLVGIVTRGDLVGTIPR